jgi:hypothetical protein
MKGAAPQFVQAITTSGGYYHRMPVTFQMVTEQGLDVRFVFNDQDARHDWGLVKWQD